MCIWTELLRQNRSGVTDRTGDRTDRTGIESKKSLEKDDEQNNAILAGKGGLLSKIETGVIGQDRRGGTERRGQTGKVRKYRAAKKDLGRTAWTRILK
jgi:hypothetical protein